MPGHAPPQTNLIPPPSNGSSRSNRSAGGPPRRTLSNATRPRSEKTPENVAHSPGPGELYRTSPNPREPPTAVTDPRRVKFSQSTVPTRQADGYGRPVSHNRSHSATSSIPSSFPQDVMRRAAPTHHRSVTELADELLLPSSRYTPAPHGYDISPEGSSKNKQSTAVQFPLSDRAANVAHIQEGEPHTFLDGILTAGGDLRNRVVSAPMQIQDPEWYTTAMIVRDPSVRSTLPDTQGTHRPSSYRERHSKGRGHSRTMSTSEFRAGPIAGDELQTLPLPSRTISNTLMLSSRDPGTQQRSHSNNETSKPNPLPTPEQDRTAQDVQFRTRSRTLNEILDYAVANDVDVADIVDHYQVHGGDLDTHALVETVLERVVERRVRRLGNGVRYTSDGEARQYNEPQTRSGDPLQCSDVSTQQVLLIVQFF